MLAGPPGHPGLAAVAVASASLLLPRALPSSSLARAISPVCAATREWPWLRAAAGPSPLGGAALLLLPVAHCEFTAG